MIIGVPREIKPDENRVGLLPVGAEMLVRDGHTVLIQRSAGGGSGFVDKEYAAAGARLVSHAADLYARCDLVVKVKEPQPVELRMLRQGQTVFTYFHFAANALLTRACLRAGITAVAYETLRDAKGRLPLLTPMSEVAGKMAVQEGAKYLERAMGGRGILLGGVPGVAPASVLVLGGGVVGTNAALVAAGMGARVVLMDVDIDRLRHLAGIMPANVTTIYCDAHAVARHIRYADLVIGAVLIPGARAPRLVLRRHIKTMKPGSVIIDVCIDQGGCVATSHPTTHHDPVFVVDGVIHYCVANMPGAVSRTSSQALCNATGPYVRQLARRGVEGFSALSPGHAAAVNIRAGLITSPAVAGAFPDLPCS